MTGQVLKHAFLLRHIFKPSLSEASSHLNVLWTCWGSKSRGFTVFSRWASLTFLDSSQPLPWSKGSCRTAVLSAPVCPWWAVKTLWAWVKGEIYNWPLLVVTVITCSKDRGKKGKLVTEMYELLSCAHWKRRLLTGLPRHTKHLTGYSRNKCIADLKLLLI